MKVASRRNGASRRRTGRGDPRTRTCGVRLLAGLTLGAGLLSVPVAALGAPRPGPSPVCKTDEATIGKIPIVFLGSAPGLEAKIKGKLGSAADDYQTIAKLYRAKGDEQPDGSDTAAAWSDDWSQSWGEQTEPPEAVVEEVARKVETASGGGGGPVIAVVVVNWDDAQKVADALENRTATNSSLRPKTEVFKLKDVDGLEDLQKQWGKAWVQDQGSNPLELSGVSKSQTGSVALSLQLAPRGARIPVQKVTVDDAEGKHDCPSGGLGLPLTVKLSDAVLTSVQVKLVDGQELVWSPDRANSSLTTTAPPKSGTGGPPQVPAGQSAATPDPTGESGHSTPVLLGVGLLGLAAGGAASAVAARRKSVPHHNPTPAYAVSGSPPVGPMGGYPLPAADMSGFRQTPPSAPNLGPSPAEHVVPGPAPAGWTGTVVGGTAIRMDDVGLARISPENLGRARSWSSITGRFVMIGGWAEKIAAKGEDAEPLFRFHDSGRGLIGVFDGTGGAGAGVARRLADGSDLTGAYVSSRLSREVLSTWISRLVDRQESVGPENVDRVRSVLRNSLLDEARYVPDTDGGLKGSLKRQLPTTLAAVAFEVADDGAVADAVWAGDSRVYALSPRAGLQALSIDDTRETDAMALIRNDMPMDNLVCADQDFRLNHRTYRLQAPALVLAATDGCFGYLHTPAHFEYLVLETLMNAADPASWAATLVEELDAVAGDDVSFVAAGFGFETFSDLKAAFAARHQYLRSEHWEPFAGATEDRDRFETLREHSWAVYKDLYQARIEPATEEP